MAWNLFAGWRKSEASSGGKIVATSAWTEAEGTDPTPGTGERVVHGQRTNQTTPKGKSLHPATATQVRKQPTSGAAMKLLDASDRVGYEVYCVGAKVWVGPDNTVTTLTGRQLFPTESILRQGPGTYQGEVWAIADGTTGDLRVGEW